MPTHVSKIDEVNRLKDRAYAAFGAVDVLMNNAGTSAGGVAAQIEVDVAGNSALGPDPASREGNYHRVSLGQAPPAKG